MQTDYEYNDRDQLVKETHTDPGVCFYLDGKPVYAYAENGQVTHYRLYGSSENIGPLKAFMIGIPTKWSNYAMTTIFGLLVAVLLLPVFISQRGHRAHRLRYLLRQLLILLLAYLMLIDPGYLQQVARASVDYSTLSRNNWGIVDTDTHYRYDGNGSQTQKIVADKDEPDPDTNFNEKTIYTYNLRNQLVMVEFTTDGANWDVTTYKYNDDGIRIEKNDNGTITEYLVDSYNHTGYAQVLEEWTDSVLTKTYIIGDDVIGEANDAGTIKYLLYDGQGSVRHHSNTSGDLITYGAQSCDTFAYDAYGQRVDPLKDTVNEGLFYTGEQWDNSAQMYYLRARYYDPLNGRFNQMDLFAGSPQDPQSLHKYTYCHNNPINSIDPSGLIDFSALGRLVVTSIQAIITAISAPVTGAFTWAATNMALITAISYYAMWTFIISSIWLAAERQGYIPQITIVGDWTVAKAVQVISGFIFFFGIIIIGSVPNWDRGPLVKQVQTRAYELRKQIGVSSRFGTTMSVGIAEKSGERVTLVATSESGSGGLYLRPGVTLKQNEILVGGSGHAEQRIVEFCKANNMKLLTIGATRPVCTVDCVPSITPTGADIVTPIKGEHLNTQ